MTPTKPGDQPPRPDPDELPEIPTPETDPRLRIPEVLTKPTPGSAPKSDAPSGLIAFAKGWGVAFDFIGTIFGGLILGYAFDAWRGTSPAGVLIGLGIGFAAALVRIIRRTLREEARTARKPK
jgi:F0F1-type ATP synthase assembly protein I